MNKLPKNMSIYRSSKVLLSKLRSTLLDDKLITAQVRWFGLHSLVQLSPWS